MKRYIEASRGNARVGIWWYTYDGEVWARSDLADNGVQSGPYIQFSNTENHMTLWREIVTENATSNASEIISKGYKSIERGRVIFNCRTMCYEVTCSEVLVRDREFRRAVVNYFDLSGNQVEFIVLDHYHREELTGNPALDELYYNSEF